MTFLPRSRDIGLHGAACPGRCHFLKTATTIPGFIAHFVVFSRRKRRLAEIDVLLTKLSRRQAKDCGW
jgi:hypothetical protein